MVSKEGFAINQVETSNTIKKYIILKRFRVPSSNTTVMNLILKYSNYCNIFVCKSVQILKREIVVLVCL